QWTWVDPYGWTWLGDEPWGWAPYHYGRWVYYNGAWAWVPRSQYYRKRSWWRPALVAFVDFNFSFGDNICWYPLSYYQRDPHSRYYRRYHPSHGGGRDGGGGGGYAGGRRDGGGRPGGGDGRDGEHKTWRGVTRVPRRNFGNETGRPVEEPIARRVLESEPEVENLPRRIGLAGSIPPGDSPRRINPEIVSRPTGAANRVPDSPMD